MVSPIIPGDDLEKKVFELLAQRKIPELSDGYFFQGDFPAREIARLSRPDIVYMKQTEEFEISISPYDVKASRGSMIAKQISPLTLKLLDQNKNGPFHDRLMENLEEHGWQNMKYVFREGAVIVKRINQGYNLGEGLAFRNKVKDAKKFKNKIIDFKERHGLYTVDTVLLKDPDFAKSKLENGRKDLEYLLRGIDWFKPKNTDKFEFVYSASAYYSKWVRETVELKSKQIIIRDEHGYRMIVVCPYILLSPEFLK